MIYIASDHGGFSLKTALIEQLKARGVAVTDLGPATADRVDYPDYAEKVARALQNDPAARGVLICTSGIGMSISANKFHDIRAALVTSQKAAEMSRRHNNANVICFGASTTTPAEAETFLETFLKTEFDGGRHAERVAIIAHQEGKDE